MSKMAGGYELAPLGTRFIALIIDGIILGIIGGLLVGFNRDVGGGLSFVIGLIYYWYFWSRRSGQSPGKSVMNIRVVKADGSPLSDTDAILRYIGYFINSVLFGLGWLWAFFDSNQQGIHDKIVNTYVVKA
jgi:uncharacterized RDD family membrane protein YckC